jgi:Cysteine-rich secretory protein family
VHSSDCPVSKVLALTAILFAATAQAPMAARTALQSRVFDRHNAERLRVGAPPLLWNADLAAHAADWAKQLARNKGFDHADQRKEGENLWAGTVNAYTPEQMVEGWIEEKSLFKPGRFPDVSTNGRWEDVGHYTQLIWANTREVGCAVASNDEEDVLVCRYSPPGNWIGQFTDGHRDSPVPVPPKLRKTKRKPG